MTASPSAGRARPPGKLAVCFQEPLTVAVRLRTNRQTAVDANAFREHVKQLLVNADEQARRAGYDPGYVRLSVYAFVAFLDESVLNSPHAMFRDWAGQPLQEEVFGDARAGETFFANLRELLTRPDTPELADVLEVYLLCLLLGFRGRYGSGESGELAALISQAREKMGRIRGAPRALSPAGSLPADDRIPETRDPWLRKLVIAAAGSFAFALALYLLYALLLGSGLRDVGALASRVA